VCTATGDIWRTEPVSLDLPAEILWAWKQSLLSNSPPLTRVGRKPSYVELPDGISFRCEKLEGQMSFITGYCGAEKLLGRLRIYVSLQHHVWKLKLHTHNSAPWTLYRIQRGCKM